MKILGGKKGKKKGKDEFGLSLEESNAVLTQSNALISLNLNSAYGHEGGSLK